jgi:osmotically-inducible protein OsmY
MDIKHTALAITLALGTWSFPAGANSVPDDLSEANKEGRIWTSFALNSHLDAFDLEVDVEGETAVLTGTVPGDIERELAEQVAMGVSGVKRVDNRIRIDPRFEPAASDGQRSPGDIAADATITASVKSKLLWSEQVSGLDIDVDTRNGVVNLKGSVSSPQERALAVELAENVGGVKRVDASGLRVTG